MMKRELECAKQQCAGRHWTCQQRHIIRNTDRKLEFNHIIGGRHFKIFLNPGLLVYIKARIRIGLHVRNRTSDNWFTVCRYLILTILKVLQNFTVCDFENHKSQPVNHILRQFCSPLGITESLCKRLTSPTFGTLPFLRRLPDDRCTAAVDSTISTTLSLITRR